MSSRASGRPTKYAKAQANKFRDVLTGKAKVISAKRHKEAIGYKARFPVKFDKIVVPTKKGETVRYDPKTHQLVKFRREYKIRIKVIVPKKVIRSKDDLPTAPRGKTYRYVLRFASGGTFRFTDLDALAAALNTYQIEYNREYKEWWKYVEIEELQLQSCLKDCPLHSKDHLKCTHTGNCERDLKELHAEFGAE